LQFHSMDSVDLGMPVRTTFEESALEQLEELTSSAQRLAICAYGPSVYGKPGAYSGQDLLVICEDYPNGLRAHRRITDGFETRFLVAERSLIESDVRKGTLGDFLTEILIYPYRSIANQAYLENLGLDAKARTVEEETRDLIIEYGEMCRGFVAEPEFFGLSRMRKRARVFLPSLDQYLRLLEPSVRQQNIAVIRDSFKKAILTLKSDVVELQEDLVALPDSIIDKWLARRSSEQVVNIMRQSRQTFYTYLTRGRVIYADLDLLAREVYRPLRVGLEMELMGAEPEDPKNYLHLRTAEGLASLNERASLEEVMSKLRPGRPITIAPLAGVLNEVFLVTTGNESYVAKKFTDWHGFKWFTLNLVSFGSKFFAVSGKARMSNEYGVNRYLAKRAIRVPQIIHVNMKERILLESYISGTPIVETLVQTMTQPALSESQYRLAESLGETLARIHAVGVSVGDSKPENFVAHDGDVYVVDLEQAGKRKDYAWDIAELLFYAGHYSVSPAPPRGLIEAVHAFIQGYARKGDPSELKRAAGVRYVKVFSLWTHTPIILEISKMLRENH
jgi:tRNA A-37 threonylcarbamoyl transferase component Bud32